MKEITITTKLNGVTSHSKTIFWHTLTIEQVNTYIKVMINEHKIDETTIIKIEVT